ncbi:MAG TPA: GDSL-type esterase/lipase family protein [Kofleriaceae bacterium]|nr:GDSL-type esterase/lipase family protein [Kofleriaceae bacterium]
MASVGPTLLWFGAAVTTGLCVLAGGLAGLEPLRARLTTRDENAALPTGPVFAGPPIAVAEANDNVDDDDHGDTAAGGGGGASAGSSAAASTGPLVDACRDGTPDKCNAWAMDGFYRAIADEKRGALGRPVRVSWYGDSVIATDAIPGRLRARLQGALGDGGPGFVFVVPPHRFCEHEAITRGSSGPWATHAISTLQTADGLYGPGGATAEATEGATATIKLVAGKVNFVELYLLDQPHGGSVTIKADGNELQHIETAADAKQVAFSTAAVSAGASKLELETHGRVRLFGVDLENASGAVVDNLGIVSVHVKSFANEDAAHWSSEIAHRGADLVMITIGANEAQWLGPADQDTKDYQAHYEQVLAPIRKARPDASCLVVSPTDQAEDKDGGYASRPVMPLLVDAQRKAALAQGCAFFSTYTWMGGKGSAAKWFRKGLVGSDFQHLSKKGANLLSDAIYDALMAGAERYAAR